MRVLEAIYQRRSVRAFSAPVPSQEQLWRLIDAAVQAPNAMNRQPWRFTVVRDRALLRHISDRAKAHVLENAREALALHGIEQMLSAPGFNIFNDAPVLIVISATESSDWAQIDCALAAQTLMLAACEEGLGSCWIGFSQAWLQTLEGRTALGLGEEAIPIAPIVLGHPLEVAASVSRGAPDIDRIGGEALA